MSPALRATALYAIAIAGTKGMGLLLLPLVTAHLAPGDYARLELLASAAEIAALLLGAGLVDTLYRFASAPGPDGRQAAAQVTGIAVVLAGAGLLLALLLMPAGAALPLPASKLEVLLIGTAVALEAAVGVPLAWLRMQGRAAAFAAISLGRTLVQTGLIAALLLAGTGVTGVLAAGAIATSLTAGWLLAGQGRATGITLAPQRWGGMLAYGLPLTAGGLAAYALGAADRWFLAGAVTPEALAHYALAMKLAMAAAFLTQPFELWWYPRRIGLLAEADGAARSAHMVGLGAVLVLLAAAAAAVGGPLLIHLATPVAYHSAATLLPWLAACLALQSLGSLVNVGCYAGRNGLQPLAVNGLAGAVALAGYALLVPGFGLAGAIGATLLAQLVRLLAFLLLSQRRAPLPYPWAALAAPALACALAAAAPQWLPGLAGTGLGLLGLMVAAGLAILLGLVPLPARLGWSRAAHA